MQTFYIISAPLEGTQSMKNDGHCHSDQCGMNNSHADNATTGKMVLSSCNHQHNAALESTIDIEPCTEHVESITNHASEMIEIGGSCNGQRPECAQSSAAAGMHGCPSLEKRKIGGCSKSYMKECCGKHGHLGATFGGGLSKIFTK